MFWAWGSLHYMPTEMATLCKVGQHSALQPGQGPPDQSLAYLCLAYLCLLSSAQLPQRRLLWSLVELLLVAPAGGSCA